MQYSSRRSAWKGSPHQPAHAAHSQAVGLIPAMQMQAQMQIQTQIRSSCRHRCESQQHNLPTPCSVHPPHADMVPWLTLPCRQLPTAHTSSRPMQPDRPHRPQPVWEPADQPPGPPRALPLPGQAVPPWQPACTAARGGLGCHDLSGRAVCAGQHPAAAAAADRPAGGEYRLLLLGCWARAATSLAV